MPISGPATWGNVNASLNAKETAWLRLASPVLCFLLLVVIIAMVRLFWQEHYYHTPRPVDREMANLYRAFHTILRQIQRITTPQQQQQQQHHHGGRRH